MGKGKKHNHDTERGKKSKKRNQRKEMALGMMKYTLNEHKFKNQNSTIPQLLSQKQKIINDLKRKEIKGSRKELIDSLSQKLKENNPSEYNNLYQLMEDTKANKSIYDKTNDSNLISNIRENQEEKKLNHINKDQSCKAFYKTLEQVIENADVILEVLDARDPLSCRSKELENLILSQKQEKKIIFILNKIDLVPVQNALDWQRYLSREYGTVLFKANTQNQNTNLSQSTLFDNNLKKNKDYIEDVLKGNKAVGGEELLNMIKNYSRTESGVKSNIVVGVVGIPNVGKSSVINSLTRGKNVGVSNTPGFTKSIQEVILDNNVRLLDCPGVVLSNNENSVLQNIIRTEDIKEPIEIVSKIFKKMSQEYLFKTYELDISVLKGSELTVEKILYLIGEKLKKYKKGGIIDLDKTARLVINDWNSGKLKYYSVPPGIDKSAFEREIISQQKTKGMDLDK